MANGGIYSGATTATLTLTAAPLVNNGFVYRAIISGDCGPNATSNAAQLTVQQAVVISTQPQASVICEDVTTSFSVTASRHRPYLSMERERCEHQQRWCLQRRNFFNTHIDECTKHFQRKTIRCSDHWYLYQPHQCTSIADGETTSEVIADPSNQTICENGNTLFGVDAGVTTNPGYQWQVSTNNGVTFANITNGGIYSGATTDTLRLTTVPLARNGNLYRAIISGDCGPNATSNPAQLTVQQAVVISTQPQASVICEDVTTSVQRIRLSAQV